MSFINLWFIKIAFNLSYAVVPIKRNSFIFYITYLHITVNILFCIGFHHIGIDLPSLMQERFLTNGAWTHIGKRLSGCNLCSSWTCRIRDLHLATINETKSCLVVVALQYIWLRIEDIQPFIFSQSLSLAAFNNFVVVVHATCHMSKKCLTDGKDSRIHFATPQCLSEMKVETVIPVLWRNAKHLCRPIISIRGELPFASFACRFEKRIVIWKSL